MINKWKQRARELNELVSALSYAYRDPRTPWRARVVIACVVGYALSPIDLIPDFIPVLGYLDDLVLFPFGVLVAVRLIPGGCGRMRERGPARPAAQPRQQTGSRPVSSWCSGS